MERVGDVQLIDTALDSDKEKEEEKIVGIPGLQTRNIRKMIRHADQRRAFRAHPGFYLRSDSGTWIAKAENVLCPQKLKLRRRPVTRMILCA